MSDNNDGPVYSNEPIFSVLTGKDGCITGQTIYWRKYGFGSQAACEASYPTNVCTSCIWDD
jgi:hypothetical protein